MLNKLLLKESRKAQEGLSLEDLQEMQVQASARLQVLEDQGKAVGLGDDYLKRVRGHLERVGRRIEAKKAAAVRREINALKKIVGG